MHGENLREEVDELRQQIREKFDAGNLDEARELQDLLRDKVIIDSPLILLFFSSFFLTFFPPFFTLDFPPLR